MTRHSNTRKIRAAVLRNRGTPLQIETLRLEGPREDEILVRIEAAGVCRTDIDICDERDEADGPGVLGHEGAGVVEEVGRKVKEHPARRPRGSFLPVLRTYSLVTERNFVKVPEDLPLELLAPLGCGIQNGAGAVMNSLGLQKGSGVAVFGAGAAGLAAVMAARIVGADPIIGVDINPMRLKTRGRVRSHPHHRQPS